MTAPVFKIVPGLQSYAWGKKGSSSLAAQLATTSIPDFTIDDEKPYAEVRPPNHNGFSRASP
jgi:mannose-6-phosphate isomerase